MRHAVCARQNLTLAIGIVVGLEFATVWGYTPDSPVVQTMVSRAVRFIEKDTRGNLGHDALAAMALYKAGKESSHPLISDAVKRSVDTCRSVESVENQLDIYQSCVVGLLLCEVDPSRYKYEIANIINSLEKRQKGHGGWGYPENHSINGQTGDTSMTQYVVLFSWMARAVNASEMSAQSIRQVTNWLIRTQDVNGGWGYQGNDPGVGNYQRRQQTEVRLSLVAAGLGSLYICSSMLGFTDGELVQTDSDVPAALKPVVLNPRERREDSAVDGRRLQRAMRDGDSFYQAKYRINPSEYTMYYLYTLERYQSFRAMAEGRNPSEPKWYNDGVRFLKSSQESDGSWNLPDGTGRLPDTAFGILFLMRSAQRTIEKASAEFHGVLTGGKGLPGDLSDVKMDRGKIVRTPFQGTADALLEILEDADHAEFDDTVANATVTLSENPAQRKQQLIRLRRLVRAEDFNIRMAAVKTLARDRNLDNVPTLIFALSDPDSRVFLTARTGLRFISRKFTGVGMSDTPTDKERQEAIQAWKQWYLSIRPDAYFPE
jgi:hypothetical protein